MNLKNKHRLSILSLVFLFILVYPTYAELLRIDCWASPPHGSSYGFLDGPSGSCTYDSDFIVIDDYSTSTTTRDCPDSVICCDTRINQDITIYARSRAWYTGLTDIKSQTFSKFSNCGGGSCGYLNDCTGQCNLKPGNSCFDGQTTCSGNNYLTCSGCTWRNNNLVAGQCGVPSNYGQSCGQCGGTIQLDGSCSVPTPSNYGSSCIVGIGACQNTGTITCSGTCSATPGTPTTEVCDNIDNDCNNLVDEGCDDDKDGFADNSIICSGSFLDGNGVVRSCSSNGNDKDDNDPNIYPGAPEICDDKDNNQNNLVDEGCDDDNDNYCDASIQIIGTPGTCTAGGNDCNDNNANVNPGVQECCDFENLVDENCNGQINEICDRDNDGFIDANAPLCVSTSQITESLAQQIVNIIRQILGI